MIKVCIICHIFVIFVSNDESNLIDLSLIEIMRLKLLLKEMNFITLKSLSQTVYLYLSILLFHSSVNLALSRNVENREPVRVIRGFKLRSPFAPEYGYRYDGNSFTFLVNSLLNPGLF